VQRGARSGKLPVMTTSERLKTGEYFDGVQAARANAQAYDAQGRRRLAEVSARLTGLDQPPGRGS
jgi:hypothetical protein